MKRLRHYLIGTALLLAVVAVPLMATTSADAAPVTHFADSVADACKGIGMTTSGGGCGDSSGLNNIIKQIIYVLSAVVGVAAVIMIILSGFRYVTSGGDASKVSAAKSSLIYAIVGLVIVALAQVIVHFVIARAS